MIKKTRKIISNVLTTFFSILSIGLLIIVVIGRINAINNDGIPKIGNYSLFFVETDSMEPTLLAQKSGIVVEYVDAVNHSEDLYAAPVVRNEDGSIISGGDIVTFIVGYGSNGTAITKTHRLIDKYEVDGVWMYQTQGDNNINSVYCSDGPCGPDTPIDGSKIIGKVIYVSNFIGILYSLVSNQFSILILVLIPLTMVVVSEGRNLFKLLKEEKQENEKEKENIKTTEEVNMKNEDKIIK